MVDSPLSAVCTSSAVALKGSGAVVWPLKVSVNVPEVPLAVKVWTSAMPAPTRVRVLV
jgi:hypothetical protein